MKLFAIFFSCLLIIILCYNTKASIIINEFQPYPIDEEPEWVELYNNSDKSITFDSLRILDNKTSKFVGKITFSPNSYYVITKDTNDLKQKFPNLFSDKNNKLIEINFPSLNNTTDEIRIYNSNKLIDSLYYDMRLGIKGDSFERISPFLNANEIGNLKTSRSANDATPLEINSWTKVDYDLEIGSLQVKNTYFTDFTFTSNLEVLINNFGLKDILGSKLNVSLIYNNDITSLIDYDVNPLTAGNKLTFNLDITNIITQTNFGGYLKFRVSITNDLDQRKGNDTLNLTHYISYSKGALLINEFIVDVNNDVILKDSSSQNIESKIMGEFIELYNNSIFDINLKNYSIDDASSYESNAGIKIEKDLIIKPKEFAVVTWDSAFFKSFDTLRYSNNLYFVQKPSFNLNITSDNIILRDEFLNVMDSVSYSSKWNSNIFKSTKNLSLERINPNGDSNDEINWSTCLDLLGATPLNKNSISIDNNTSINNIDISPNPFSPKIGGINSNCKISFNFNFQYANITIRIFDLYGNLMTNVIENRALPSSYTIIWEGTGNNGNILPVGAYVVMVEATDNVSGDVQQLKKLIAIGE